MDIKTETESAAKTRGPSRPTAELIKQFALIIQDGLPLDVACDYLGVPPQTFHLWIKKGKMFNQDPEVEPKHRIFGDFEMALRKAAATYYLTVVRRLHAVDNGRWQRDLAILERRDKKNFGKFDLTGGSDNAFEQLDPSQKYS